MDKNNVVITGLGVVTGHSLDVEAFWSGMLSGDPAFTLETGFTEEPAPLGRVTGNLADLIPQDIQARTSRCVHLGLPAAQQALGQAGLGAPIAGATIGICIGSGLGGLDFHEDMIAKALEGGMRKIHPFTIPKVMPSALGAWVAQQTGITGPNLCISTACASSANAVAEAYWKIRTGQWDMALVGGAEAPISNYTYNAYKRMKVLSKSRDTNKTGLSFRPDRDGFILAEGAGFLFMESAESAQRRGAPVLARLAGVAQNSGAYHPVVPRPDASDIILAMRAALACAGLSAGDIDGICAHGTGTVKNDEVEYLGMHGVFGDQLAETPVFAPKNQTGHTLGACGIIESILCIQALLRQTLPQGFLLGEGMTASAPANRPGRYRNLMNNSFGFGSNNVSLIFQSAEPEPI